MSTFSEHCKRYVEESGLTLYEFSQKSGIERTTLYRMINGKRLPSKDVFLNFCSFLRLNNYNRDILYELYYEERIGTATYKNRKFIHSLIENMDFIHQNSMLESNSVLSIGLPIFQNQELSYTTTNSLQTKNTIHQLLIAAFSDSKIQNIYTNIPQSNSDFFANLPILFHQNNTDTLNFYHLLTFLSKPERNINPNYNLEILEKVLPLSIVPRKNYYPYYHYNEISMEEMTICTFPYYLVSETFALEIDTTFSSAILHVEPNIIALFQKRINGILKNMCPLFELKSNFMEASDYYYEFTKKHLSPTYIMEYSPCVSHLVNLNRISHFIKLLPQPISGTVGSNMISYITNAKNTATKHIFSERGLDYFWQHGKLLGQGAALLPPFPVRIRKHGIQNFIKIVEQENSPFFCIKENFHAPQTVYLELHESPHILLILFTPNSELRFCHIQEASLYYAFEDFLSSINDMNLLLSKEEFLQKLNSYVS